MKETFEKILAFIFLCIAVFSLYIIMEKEHMNLLTKSITSQ